MKNSPSRPATEVERLLSLPADEPTGSLDSRRSEKIGEVLCRFNRAEGLTLIMVLAGRWIEMRDGRAYES